MFLKRRTMWLVGAVSLLPSAALAADNAGTRRSNAQAGVYQLPAVSTWSGPYVGLHSGFASREINPFSSGRGFIGGVQAGYNLQIGGAVVGAEIDGSYLGGVEQRVPNGVLEETWRLAAKARAGIAMDQTLLFGTIGYALTQFERDDTLSGGGGWQGGFLFGAGVEHGFADGLSVKLEYNYINTSTIKTTSPWGQFENDLTSHVLKAGFNYRF